MKKLFFLLSGFYALSSLAQTAGDTIPNAKMERWTNYFFTYDEPDSWFTTNQLKALDINNPVAVFKTSDSYSGLAARIKTVALASPPDANFDTLGMMLCKSVDINTLEFEGFPYTHKPLKLQFYAKYLPAGADSAFVEVSLFKRDTATGSSFIVAEGEIQISDTISSYTLHEINLTYLDSSVSPDTALIVVSSSGFINPKAGSELFIDEFSFTGTLQAPDVSISDNKITRHTKAYPNPASGQVTFQLPENAETLAIFDVTGRNLGSATLSDTRYILNVAAYPTGIYFYQVKSKESTISSGRFSVLR